ncbi:PF03932 family protein CutC [Anticarsia gemmatalis]|uniref:PF03932 family protein CutC n=1 Tax=Anticarsia gemmatalis TaxID=129554 RepID=UPI003F767DDA
MLEVCIDSLESAINAIHGGADELEVCSSLTEGGLTPSPGLVKQILDMVTNISAGKPIRKSCHECGCDKLTKKPKVNVMVRCRTGSNFHYSEEEMETMLSDVDVFKDFGVDRFVFGALTDAQDIDETSCEKIVQRAFPVPVTFHRAFDVSNDPHTAISKIAALGFNRLLTSGQKSSANQIEAIQLIKSLISSVGNKIEIMPGAGVNINNAQTFIEIGCQIVHSSCKRIRYLPKISNSLSMGTSDSEHIFVTDENIVRKMKEIIILK